MDGPQTSSPRAAASAAAHGPWAAVMRSAARQIAKGHGPTFAQNRIFSVIVFSEACLVIFVSVFPTHFLSNENFCLGNRRKVKEILLKSIKVYEFLFIYLKFPLQIVKRNCLRAIK